VSQNLPGYLPDAIRFKQIVYHGIALRDRDGYIRGAHVCDDLVRKECYDSSGHLKDDYEIHVVMMYNDELAKTSESLTNLFLKLNDVEFTKCGAKSWNDDGNTVMNKKLELGIKGMARVETNCIYGSKFRKAFERKIYKY